MGILPNDVPQPWVVDPVLSSCRPSPTHCSADASWLLCRRARSAATLLSRCGSCYFEAEARANQWSPPCGSQLLGEEPRLLLSITCVRRRTEHRASETDDASLRSLGTRPRRDHRGSLPNFRLPTDQSSRARAEENLDAYRTRTSARRLGMPAFGTVSTRGARRRFIPSRRACAAAKCSREPLWERLGMLAGISPSQRNVRTDQSAEERLFGFLWQ